MLASYSKTLSIHNAKQGIKKKKKSNTPPLFFLRKWKIDISRTNPIEVARFLLISEYFSNSCIAGSHS